MFPFFIGMVSCLGVFFRSRYNLGLYDWQQAA